MKFKEIVSAVFVFGIAIICIITFSSCESLSKFIVVTEYNSASNPGGRVAFGTKNSTSTNDTSSWFFDRDESGQYYFEFSYRIRTGNTVTNNLTVNLADNVMANMVSSVNLNSITLKINEGNEISLTGNPVPNQANTFRFPVSVSIASQLLSSNSFTLRAVGQGIHTEHQEPNLVWEGGRGIMETKRFINYWNEGGTPVNVVSVTETQRENNQITENATRVVNENNKKLRYSNHPPNCCHNVFGRRR